jgi:hypothetical protein
MTVFKPENCKDESEIVYYCDHCGGSSNFSDYWWPGCYHWEEWNYTLCNDCLRVLAGENKGNGEVAYPDAIKWRHAV